MEDRKIEKRTKTQIIRMQKKFGFAFFFIFFFTIFVCQAQQPLYIVNGQAKDHISDLPPDAIERVESLPADEESIAKYGEKAAYGVILITLKLDKDAVFRTDSISFEQYIAQRVEWTEDEPAARVVVRYTITESGDLKVEKILEATDKRLKRRVIEAMEEAPQWTPARKNGKAVPSQHVLKIQLPKGKKMPRPIELVWW